MDTKTLFGIFAIVIVAGFIYFSNDAKQNSCEGLNYTAKITGCYEDRICINGGTFNAQIAFDNKNPNILFKDLKIGVKNPNIQVDSVVGAFNVMGKWQLSQTILPNSSSSPVSITFNTTQEMQENLDSIFEVHYICNGSNFTKEAIQSLIFEKNYSFRKPNIEMDIKRSDNPFLSSPKQTQFVEIKNIDRIRNVTYRLEITTMKEMQIIGQINGVELKQLEDDRETGRKKYVVDKFFLDPYEEGFVPLQISLEKGYTEQSREVEATLYYYVEDQQYLLTQDSQKISLGASE